MMADVLKDVNDTGVTGEYAVSNTFVHAGVSFVADYTYDMINFQLYCRKYATSTDTFSIGLYLTNASHEPTGDAIESISFELSTMPSSATWTEFEWDTPVSITEGVEYFIKISKVTFDFTPSFRYRAGSGPADEWGGYYYDDEWTLYNNDMCTYFRCYAAGGPDKATDPDPADDEEDVDFSSKELTWTNGAGTLTWQLYIGDAADNLTLVDNGTAAYYTLSDVQRALFTDQCFWRVDTINGDGTTTGDVWDFTCAAPGKAQTPAPTDNQEDIKIAGMNALEDLTWEAPD